MGKLIFVSGGVCSSLGKGVAASSLGALLESRGLNVRMVKCDPYINVDAGTQSPYQHGEVYVTDDGAQTDLDLGNYARFTSGPLSQANSITTGQVYNSVIHKEREGRYRGRCVQVIPHITDEIKTRIMAVAKEDPDIDIVIIEIGGTVGDIESIPFLEAARQLIRESGRSNAISVHLTLIPDLGGGELKTKPTQHSVKAMQELGIQPDVLICRAPAMLEDATRRKIALFTNMEDDSVFTLVNVSTTIYEVPLMFFEQKLDQIVIKKLGIEAGEANIKPWEAVIKRTRSRKKKLKIGIIGKYIELHDAYKSVYEALFHASLECGVDIELVKISASRLEPAAKRSSARTGSEIRGSSTVEADPANLILKDLDGILVPSGFGRRGVNGMVKAAAWARKNKVPYFGISMGMHVMLIDWGRNVLGWEDADSTEFNKETGHPIINDESGSRLGKSHSLAEPGTKFFAAYRKKDVQERHRHRHAFSIVKSQRYFDEIVQSGLVIGAMSREKDLVECVEWPNSGVHKHPWGLGVQSHPEFKSKPTAASPLFRDFIIACQSKKAVKTAKAGTSL